MFCLVVFVCFLAYVLWKTLGQRAKRSGLADEPRRIFDCLSEIDMVDVVLPTRLGEIRRTCITSPDGYQRILLQRLGLSLPRQLTQK